MFATAHDALQWFRERGYPTPSQVVFTEPPLSEGVRNNIQEWALLVNTDTSVGLPLQIYWIRPTRNLYTAVKQFVNRYPNVYALFVVKQKQGCNLLGVYRSSAEPTVLHARSIPLDEGNAHLMDALHYTPDTPAEKHWQRILRAIIGEEAMHPRIERAFENFLAELYEILAEAQEMIKRKAEEGCFSEIAELSRQAEQVQRLVEETKMLRERWDTLQPMAISPSPTTRSRRKRTKRASAGEITPQAGYIRPLLQALVDLGGGAPMGKVLDRVYELVKHRLKPKDLETVPSGGDLRWRIATMWMRYNLKRQGYIKSNSPKGIWEITDAGRAYLQQLQTEDTEEFD